jgi:hypothetical protein
LYKGKQCKGRIRGIFVINTTEAPLRDLASVTVSDQEALLRLLRPQRLGCTITPFLNDPECHNNLLLDHTLSHLVLDTHSLRELHVCMMFDQENRTDRTKHMDCQWTCTHAVARKGKNKQEFKPVPLSSVPWHCMDLIDYRQERLRTVHPMTPILRLCCIIFYDEFGTYGKTYHKVGGGYLTLGNLPLYLQKQLHNMIPVIIKHPDINEQAAFHILRCEMQELERGKFIDFGPVLGVMFVIGGLGCLRTDLPQGNIFAGVKKFQNNTKCGCRKCLVKTGCLDQTFPSGLPAPRTLQSHWKQYEECKESTVATAKKLGTMYGITMTNVKYFGAVKFNPMVQLPHDPFHNEIIGMCTLLLASIGSAMTTVAWKEFNCRLTSFPLPANWRRSALPAVRLHTSKLGVKCTGRDLYMLFQILPFIFRDWLCETHFKDSRFANFKNSIGRGSTINGIVKAVTTQSSLNAILFSRIHKLDSAKDVDVCVRAAREAFRKLLPDLAMRPNFHMGLHH